MSQLAPELTLRAALRVLYVAAYTTRNRTLSEDISRKQLNDLWEAIHELPSVLTHWHSTEKCEAELKMYLREYDGKWPTPKLEQIFENALRNPEP